MDADWVDGSGEPIDISSTVHPDQLNLTLPGLPRGTRSDPPVRYWRTSLAAEEPDDLGSFDYRRHPEIFLGRTGLGPLRVACDTNILIDILTY
jgi:hypothetical protein